MNGEHKITQRHRSRLAHLLGELGGNVDHLGAAASPQRQIQVRAVQFSSGTPAALLSAAAALVLQGTRDDGFQVGDLGGDAAPPGPQPAHAQPRQVP